jgi:hypothetical protein
MQRRIFHSLIEKKDTHRTEKVKSWSPTVQGMSPKLAAWVPQKQDKVEQATATTGSHQQL